MEGCSSSIFFSAFRAEFDSVESVSAGSTVTAGCSAMPLGVKSTGLASTEMLPVADSITSVDVSI